MTIIEVIRKRKYVRSYSYELVSNSRLGHHFKSVLYHGEAYESGCKNNTTQD
ncbi:hypothetical protein [Bacteroides propionicifaciens]|uniref:hypothetical protein n=1 Tax=Bacteroides propionicifaciens TaxID=392838 RepID=UPI0012DCC098|nr:hypothetical protein [Bacteroides propionicifaciens]